MTKITKQSSKQNVVYAFIDSQNLNLGVKNDIFRKGKKVYAGWRLDFKKFYIYLKDKYNVQKAYLFIGMKPGNESLYKFLQESGYILVFKPTLKIKKDGVDTVKGNVDAELVLHAMIEYPNYDKAIIVSGDGDFYCLIEYLEKQNKLARLLIPNRKAYSSLLWKFRKYMDFINVLKEKLEYRKKKEV